MKNYRSTGVNWADESRGVPSSKMLFDTVVLVDNRVEKLPYCLQDKPIRKVASYKSAVDLVIKMSNEKNYNSPTLFWYVSPGGVKLLQHNIDHEPQRNVTKKVRPEDGSYQPESKYGNKELMEKINQLAQQIEDLKKTQYIPEAKLPGTLSVPADPKKPESIYGHLCRKDVPHNSADMEASRISLAFKGTYKVDKSSLPKTYLFFNSHAWNYTSGQDFLFVVTKNGNWKVDKAECEFIGKFCRVPLSVQTSGKLASVQLERAPKRVDGRMPDFSGQTYLYLPRFNSPSKWETSVSSAAVYDYIHNAYFVYNCTAIGDCGSIYFDSTQAPVAMHEGTQGNNKSNLAVPIEVSELFGPAPKVAEPLPPAEPLAVEKPLDVSSILKSGSAVTSPVAVPTGEIIPESKFNVETSSLNFQ